MATVLVFTIVIYFQGFRVDLPIKHQQSRGQQSTYPIKLFYTSNMPIILQTALVSNLYFMSQLVYKRFPKNIVVGLIGSWKESGGGQMIPVNGLAYYISPPQGLTGIVKDPLHACVYIGFVLTTCGL